MQEFGLDAIDVAKFQLSGTQLLSLSKEDFLERTPPYTGDVLYAHLKLLQARSGKKKEPDVYNKIIYHAFIVGLYPMWVITYSVI